MADEKKPTSCGLIVTARPQPGKKVAATVEATNSNVVHLVPPSAVAAADERERKK